MKVLFIAATAAIAAAAVFAGKLASDYEQGRSTVVVVQAPEGGAVAPVVNDDMSRDARQQMRDSILASQIAGSK